MFVNQSDWKFSLHMQPAATNTYQCVLATNRTVSFALFLFADNLMEWIISDIEGAHPALVGFNSGDGVTSLTLPTSRTDHVLNITTSSNIQSPGMWLFRTDSNDIKMPRKFSSSQLSNILRKPLKAQIVKPWAAACTKLVRDLAAC